MKNRISVEEPKQRLEQAMLETECLLHFEAPKLVNEFHSVIMFMTSCERLM